MSAQSVPNDHDKKSTVSVPISGCYVQETDTERSPEFVERPQIIWTAKQEQIARRKGWTRESSYIDPEQRKDVEAHLIAQARSNRAAKRALARMSKQNRWDMMCGAFGLGSFPFQVCARKEDRLRTVDEISKKSEFSELSRKYALLSQPSIESSPLVPRSGKGSHRLRYLDHIEAALFGSPKLLTNHSACRCLLAKTGADADNWHASRVSQRGAGCAHARGGQDSFVVSLFWLLFRT